MVMIAVRLAVGAAYVAPVLRGPIAGPKPAPAALAVTPRTAPPAALLEEVGLASSQLLAFDFPGGTAGLIAAPVALLAVVALLAGKGSLEAGAALMLVFFAGDPDEKAREEKGGFLIEFAQLITPSAWKKAYLGERDEEDGPKVLLDLPAWQGEEARELVEPEAVAGIKAMKYEPFEVPGVAKPINTCFLSELPAVPADAPPVMLIHGFDSSVLEFRCARTHASTSRASTFTAHERARTRTRHR